MGELLSKMKANRLFNSLLVARRYVRYADYQKWVDDYSSYPLSFRFNEFGKRNKDKVIYLINENSNTKGFCCLLRHTIIDLFQADHLNFIPIVNWMPNTIYYDKKYSEKTGIENVFEYYFEPVSDIKVEDALHSYNVCIGNARAMSYYHTGYDEEIAIDLVPIVNRYINLKPAVKQYINTEINQTIGGKATLAVHVRFTEFGKIKDHPNKIPIEKYFDAIDNAMQTNNYEQIFLATDSLDAIEIFEHKYGDKVVFYKNISHSGKGIDLGPHANPQIRSEVDGYKLGLDIIKDVYTISSCSGFVSGISNVSLIADLFKECSGKTFDYRKELSMGIYK